MLNMLKIALFAIPFLPSGTGLAHAHGTHVHTEHNQHLVSIIQPDKIYKDGDPVVMEFEARNLLSGNDVGPYTGELKIFLNSKFHIVSDTYGRDTSLGYQGDSCFDNPSYLMVEFDDSGRSVSKDNMQIFTINDTTEFGRVNLNNSDVIYSDGKLSHIEVELITGCYEDPDSYIVSAQKFANYLTENSIIGEFNNVSRETADKVEESLATAFNDNDERFSYNMEVNGREKIALNADFTYKFNDMVTLWGDGDVADLEGTVGFNLRSGQNYLVGLSGTLNNESLSLSTGEYNTEVTTINPYLFFKSDDWSNQLLLMAGYGTGNVDVDVGRLNYHDRGELYVAHFNGKISVYRPFSLAAEGWYANHYLHRSESFVTTYNTHLSLQFVIENFKSYVNVEHDLYSDFDTVLGANARFGTYYPYFEWSILDDRVKGGAAVKVNENLAFQASANNAPVYNFGGKLNW